VVWRVGRVNLAEHLRHGLAGFPVVSGSRWARQVLAGGQVALSLTLLLTAGLLMRSLFVLGHVDLGLEPQRALVVSLGRTPLEILDRFRTLPGVAAVAAADTKPFTRGEP